MTMLQGKEGEVACGSAGQETSDDKETRCHARREGSEHVLT